MFPHTNDLGCIITSSPVEARLVVAVHLELNLPMSVAIFDYRWADTRAMPIVIHPLKFEDPAILTNPPITRTPRAIRGGPYTSNMRSIDWFALEMRKLRRYLGVCFSADGQYFAIVFQDEDNCRIVFVHIPNPLQFKLVRLNSLMAKGEFYFTAGCREFILESENIAGPWTMPVDMGSQQEPLVLRVTDVYRQEEQHEPENYLVGVLRNQHQKDA
jgi:hypothetical protein